MAEIDGGGEPSRCLSLKEFNGVVILQPGLGFLPYGNAVHCGHRRRPFHALMAEGRLPTMGHATDAGAGLYYRGTKLAAAVADRANAAAYEVERTSAGLVKESVIEPRRLR